MLLILTPPPHSFAFCQERFWHWGSFREIWKLEDSFLDGIYGNLSKFLVLKHFGLDVLHKELFTIYTLKSVFCKDNSVEYVFDRCVEFYVETPQKITETRIGNTLSKFTAIHRPWRKLCGGICRY